MKNEASIEARTVAQLEAQLTQMEREILQALQESALYEPPQNSHEKGTYQ